MAISAVLNTNKLAQNGYANIFYSAGVKSMLRSLHNFLFVSFDPGGLITVDKPPLALWVQAASAKVFGFSPLSLLLPEAIAGVLAVALLYFLMERRLGTAAAFAGALTLAVLPSFVAVSRDNGVDPVLILLMVLACSLGLRATESGRWRTLVCCGVIVGLAFNTKTLAAYLVVPGIAVAYLVCAPGSLLRRIAQLLVAGLVMAAVSFAWIAFVDLTPASKRPYVGSSTNNSELGLTFEYNGVGRVEGQEGGPNHVPVRPGAYVPAARQRAVNDAARAAARAHRAEARAALPPRPGRGTAGAQAGARAARPRRPRAGKRSRFPSAARPARVRLFGVGPRRSGRLDAAVRAVRAVRRGAARAARPQGGPSAGGVPVDGLAAAATRGWRPCWCWAGGFWWRRRCSACPRESSIPTTSQRSSPGPRRWPARARWPSSRWPGDSAARWSLALMACAVAATVLAQVVLMQREHYMLWFVPVLVVGAAVGVGAFVALRRLAAPAVAVTFLLLLVTPTAYATSTWLAPVEGTFPVAGPRHLAGSGGYGVSQRDLAIDRALADYVQEPPSRLALGAAHRRLRYGRAADALRAGRGRAGRLQRHRPGARRSGTRAAGGAGRGTIRAARRRVLPARGQSAPRRRCCVRAPSWRRPPGTAPSAIPSGSCCSTAPGANGRSPRAEAAARARAGAAR